MTVMCDRTTLEVHGWGSLQTTIEPLLDIDISLSAIDPEETKKGYFTALLPSVGARTPSPDAPFVHSIYQKLEKAGYLERKTETEGTTKFCIQKAPPTSTR